jgi:hypothetical protein
MEPILSFEEKSIWSRCNNTINLWLADNHIDMSERAIRSAFKGQPFFIFHPNISIAVAIFEALDFDFDEGMVIQLERVIESAPTVHEDTLTRIQFKLGDAWGMIDLNIVGF